MTTGEDTNVIVKKIGALIDVDINDTDISISQSVDQMNKFLILICLVTHFSLNPLHKGQVELVCILGMVFNLVLDMTLPLALVKVKCYGLKLRVI